MDFIWERLFGGNPREVLLADILRSMLEPQQPQLVIQSYYDQLSIFAIVALMLWCAELGVRVIKAARGSELVEEGKQLLASGLFLFVIVATLPGALAAVQTATNELARWAVLGLVDAEGVDAFVADASALSDNSSLNTVLAIVQLLFLLLLGISLYLVPLFLWLASFALTIGVMSRWAGGFGQALYVFSLNVTVFALFANGFILILYGLGVTAAKSMYEPGTLGLALANTGAVVLASVVSLLLLFVLRRTIKSVADKVTERANPKGGVGRSRGRSGKSAGGGDRTHQGRTDAHTKRTGGSKASSAPKGYSPDKQQPKNGSATTGSSTASSGTTATPSSRPATTQSQPSRRKTWSDERRSQRQARRADQPRPNQQVHRQAQYVDPSPQRKAASTRSERSSRPASGRTQQPAPAKNDSQRTTPPPRRARPAPTHPGGEIR